MCLCFLVSRPFAPSLIVLLGVSGASSVGLSSLEKASSRDPPAAECPSSEVLSEGMCRALSGMKRGCDELWILPEGRGQTDRDRESTGTGSEVHGLGLILL